MVRQYGFAVLVLASLVGATYLAKTVKVPHDVPDFALQAESIYRLEIGAASFVVFYLGVMAFVLALGGRGFAQFGTKGVATDQVVDRQQNLAVRGLARTNRLALTGLADLRAVLQSVAKTLESHDERLGRLEERAETVESVDSSANGKSKGTGSD
ncbi:MAG TPA: hypothetical protein VG816_09275 [Solirubrobacterales bacterium]|nr:hypothetical protein [Solirubrobacterales bacterium]